MGKTANGAVWLDANKTTPFEFYQYWRNVSDDDVMKCIRMLTFIPLDKIDEMDQWEDSRINEKKDVLAYELTALVHGEDEAKKAQQTSQALFGGGGDDANMPSTKLDPAALVDNTISVIDMLVTSGLAKSKGEARRLIEQGGISIDGDKIGSIDVKVAATALAAGVVLKKGKKVFHKFML